MDDKDATISKLAILKSILESGKLPISDPEAQKAWIKEIFDFSMTLINAPGQVLRPEPSQTSNRQETPHKSYAVPPGEDSIRTLIQKITELKTKKGTAFWVVKDSEGATYSTFDQDTADQLRHLQQAGQECTVNFKVEEYGGKLYSKIVSVK